MAHPSRSQISRPMLFACFLGGAGLMLTACTAGTLPQATVTVTAAPSDAVSPSAGAPSSESATSTDGATAEPEQPSDAPAALSALVASGKTALGKVPGDVTGIEAQIAGKFWEVTVFSSEGVEQEMRVNSDGTQVVSGPTKERTNSIEARRYRSLIDAAKLDYAQAAEAITQAAPQAAIRELSLDSWRGTTTWESEVREGTRTREIYVDAATGKIIKNELD